MKNKRIFTIISSGVISICILFLLITIVSTVALILGKDINMQNRFFTIISNSENSLTKISFALILIFAAIGFIIGFIVNKK